jgi:hypothetical protein
MLSTENNEKTPRLPTPGSLEAKMKLLALLPYDARARRRHCLVFGFVVDWYHSKFGDALASVRHVVDKMEERRLLLPNGKGLGLTQTHSALVELVAWNFLTETKGKGRWANRYVPNWALVCTLPASNDISVPSCPDAISVPPVPNNGVPPVPNAKAISVPTSGNKDPLTGPGQRTGPLLNGNTDAPAAPTAPPSPDANAPAGADAARVPDAFAEFWSVYPKKLKKAKARLAYEKLAPDTGLHTLIVEKARELAAHHHEHETPAKWIREPANWLAGEGWDEDIPPVYEDPKAAAISKRRANKRGQPANDNTEFIPRTDWQRVEIIASEVVNLPKGSALVATVQMDSGETVAETIILEDAKQDVQEAGQKQFAHLRIATGLSDINASEELHFIPFERRVYGGKPEYRPIAEQAAA